MSDAFVLNVGQATEFQFAWDRNGGTKADLKALSTGDMVAQVLPVIRGYGRVVVEVLEKLGEAVCLGSERFVAMEKFTEPKFWLSEDFKRWMLPKVEYGVKSSVLNYGRLVQTTKDTVILASLGGEEKAGTSLAELSDLLERQINGEEGALLTNGWANIFYIKDATGVLRTMDAYWRGGRWGLYAGLSSDRYEWGAEDRVFSRN